MSRSKRITDYPHETYSQLFKDAAKGKGIVLGFREENDAISRRHELYSWRLALRAWISSLEKSAVKDEVAFGPALKRAQDTLMYAQDIEIKLDNVGSCELGAEAIDTFRTTAEDPRGTEWTLWLRNKHAYNDFADSLHAILAERVRANPWNYINDESTLMLFDAVFESVGINAAEQLARIKAEREQTVSAFTRQAYFGTPVKANEKNA